MGNNGSDRREIDDAKMERMFREFGHNLRKQLDQTAKECGVPPGKMQEILDSIKVIIY